MQDRHYLPCDADEYHRLEVAELPPMDREWSLCDIASLLREGRYDDLDRQLEQSLAASFLSRDAEQRYYYSWIGIESTPDLYNLNAAGPEGLAQIKAWQDACPESNHAYLAEAGYWHHHAWLYRSHGWARETTSAMWACAAACNEMVILAVLKALTLQPRQWMAAAMLIPAISVFNVPAWLARMVAGKQAVDKRISALDHLRGYHQQHAEEIDALMAYSGLKLDTDIAVPESLPAVLLSDQTDKARSGPHYWLFASLHIHPTQFYIFTAYIPFQMPRWRGSQREMRQLIASPVCAHLSEQERDRLRHLVWWDDFRDDLGHIVEDLTERERQFTEVKREAENALNADDRATALRWLAASYYAMQDEPAAWHYLQRAVALNPSLGEYLYNAALRLSDKYSAETRWKHNLICHNAQLSISPRASVLQAYSLLTGLFGFNKDEVLAGQWLQFALKNDPTDAWDQTCLILDELGYHQHALRLLSLGVEYGARGTAATLASFYERGEKVTQDIPRAIELYRQVVEQNSIILSQRATVKYPLIENRFLFSYENELKNVYQALAHCYQLCSFQETDAKRVAELELLLVESLKSSLDLGKVSVLPLLLSVLSELNTLSITHQHLDFLLEHGNQGSIPAMLSLAKIYYNRKDKKLYNYKLSARWIYFAETLAPDDESVNQLLYSCHARNRWATYRYAWATLRISAHEIPGQDDNSMV